MKRRFIILAVFALAIAGFTSCSKTARCYEVTYSDKNTSITMYKWFTPEEMKAEATVFNETYTKTMGATCVFKKAGKYGTKENCLAASPSDAEWEAFINALIALDK